MTVKLITFKTNQTLIGDIVETTVEDALKIKCPVQVISQPGKDGMSMMAFAPYLEYAEEFKSGIMFDINDILTVNSPVRELENQYNQVFGSGIVLASKI
jgi:hypothetical protein